MSACKKLLQWIITENIGEVFVEEETYIHLQTFCEKKRIHSKLKNFHKDRDDLTGIIDLVVCLGGDGTLLFASSLFQNNIPPVMAFNFGTLGFLTPFQFDKFHESIPAVINGDVKIIQRGRLQCSISLFDQPKLVKQCLNEVVIDRGSMPFLSNLDIHINGHYVTTVAGDGVIISTPTGSTAYAMAVGASMIHPSVNCILIAPISPHSLSFRPIILPIDNVEVCVTPNPSAKSHRADWSACISIDGRCAGLLKCDNDQVRITKSSYPLPSLCHTSEASDWFSGLAQILHWNTVTKRTE